LMLRRAAALCFADAMPAVYRRSRSQASTVRALWSGGNTR
jgi:hypothetical protein